MSFKIQGLALDSPCKVTWSEVFRGCLVALFLFSVVAVIVAAFVISSSSAFLPSSWGSVDSSIDLRTICSFPPSFERIVHNSASPK